MAFFKKKFQPSVCLHSLRQLFVYIFTEFVDNFFRSRFASLNKHHAYFLCVDNGTVGKYGAELALRRKLEKFISTQSLGGSQGKILDYSEFFCHNL